MKVSAMIIKPIGIYVKVFNFQLIQVTEASFKHTLYDNKHSIFENNVVDSKKVLHKDFGGKRALASYERLKRSAPNVEVLEDTLERQLDAIANEKFFEHDIFDQSQEERKKFSQSIFPDVDVRGGIAIRDIFNARKLLGNEIMDHLADVAVQLLQAKQLPFVNNYLVNTVRSLQMKKNPDAKENIERISILAYVDGLIRLINNVKRSVENVELSQISAQIEHDIRKKFTIQSSFINSKFTRQKSIIYYLILILISTDSLEIDLTHVMDGVKSLAKTELLKYATVIGAKVKNKTILYISRANLDKDSKLSAPMPSIKRRRK